MAHAIEHGQPLTPFGPAIRSIHRDAQTQARTILYQKCVLWLSSAG